MTLYPEHWLLIFLIWIEEHSHQRLVPRTAKEWSPNFQPCRRKCKWVWKYKDCRYHIFPFKSHLTIHFYCCCSSFNLFIFTRTILVWNFPSRWCQDQTICFEWQRKVFKRTVLEEVWTDVSQPKFFWRVCNWYNGWSVNFMYRLQWECTVLF